MAEFKEAKPWLCVVSTERTLQPLPHTKVDNVRLEYLFMQESFLAKLHR